MVDLQPCESSAVLAFGYDAASRTLAIKFNSGKVHNFADVPPDVAEAFRAARSKGRAFISLIRGQYGTTVAVEEDRTEKAD